LNAAPPFVLRKQTGKQNKQEKKTHRVVPLHVDGRADYTAQIYLAPETLLVILYS
jgi:hypothetical protein